MDGRHFGLLPKQLLEGILSHLQLQQSFAEIWLLL